MKSQDRVCHLFREALPAYVAGTLEPLDRRLVQGHLAGCLACTAEVAAWRQIRTAAKAAPSPLPSPSVLQGVLANLDRGEYSTSRTTGWWRWPGDSRDLDAARASRRGGRFAAPGLHGRSLAALHLSATVTLVVAIVAWALIGRGTIPFRGGLEGVASQPAGSSPRMLAVDVPGTVVRDPSFASLSRLTLGSSDEVIADGFPGTALLVADSGTVTVHPGSEAIVVRADPAPGATAEPVKARQAIELGRGDAISLPADAGYAVRNAAASEASVVVAGLYGPGPPRRPEGPAVVASGSARLHVPAGPVTVDLARWIVPTTVAVSNGDQGAVMLWIEEGSVVSLAASSDSVSDGGGGPDMARSQEPPLVAGDAVGVQPGVEITLRNDDDAPAVVLTLVVTPVEAAERDRGSALRTEARLSQPPWASLPRQRHERPVTNASTPPCEAEQRCRSSRAPPLSRLDHA